ncbi:hypothetical protein [Mycolicibacterium palauense]|uniref:hypothetical protein n=1 Tax=Mycolicibacterium palauense TaxID=2034511 RepID=UPI000BFEFFC3|nr:hypothetical protein [Mycolicibacterium palauense]
MSGLDTERAGAALRPVRAAILRRADDDAARVVAAARAEADRVLVNADHTARQIEENARAAGRKAGARAADADAAGLRRGLRRQVLSARDDAYLSWRRRATEAVLQLRADPEYRRWKDALARTAREALGEEARVVEHPDGGVVAELGGRRLDLSLPAIAARALDRAAVDVDGLWS